MVFVHYVVWLAVNAAICHQFGVAWGLVIPSLLATLTIFGALVVSGRDCGLDADDKALFRGLGRAFILQLSIPIAYYFLTL